MPAVPSSSVSMLLDVSNVSTSQTYFDIVIVDPFFNHQNCRDKNSTGGITDHNNTNSVSKISETMPTMSTNFVNSPIPYTQQNHSMDSVSDAKKRHKSSSDDGKVISTSQSAQQRSTSPLGGKGIGLAPGLTGSSEMIERFY